MDHLVHGTYALHTAASATARGNLVPCGGVGAVGVQVANTGGTFTITFEATVDGTTWVAVPGVNKATGVTATTTSATGIYIVDIGGCAQFSARISAASGCSVTCTAFLYEGGAADLLGDTGDFEAMLTALQTIDNFISGSRGLVTEDNSASILTSVQTIDNFISGSKGLVTEDNSAAIASSVKRWAVNDVSTTVANVTFVGKEQGDGTWWIMKIDTTTGVAITHAAIGNNGLVTTYAAAWAAKGTTLIFGAYSGAF